MTTWDEMFDRSRLERKTSDRTQRLHRLEVVRQETMRLRWGLGPDGQTCSGCANLVRVMPGAKSFLKCRLYGTSRSDASDWRAKWPACGAYRVGDA